MMATKASDLVFLKANKIHILFNDEAFEDSILTIAQGNKLKNEIGKFFQRYTDCK